MFSGVVDWFPIPYVYSHHLHLLADKNSAFEICGSLFSLPLSNSVNLFIALWLFLLLAFQNILIIGLSVYLVRGQNRLEGICPVVNQLSIIPVRGRTLWGICFHTLVVIVGVCSVVLALCISRFWFTVVAIQKEWEGCLLHFMLYSTLISRCHQSLLYSLLEGDCLKSLLGCLYVYAVICPNIHCSGSLFYSKKFLLPINSQVDKSVLQMWWTCGLKPLNGSFEPESDC